MAGKLNVEVVEPKKGLYTDSSEENQPEGSYRFALNALHESRQGDMGFITNERGTALCTDGLPKGYQIIGNIPLVNDEFIVFLVDTTGSATKVDHIGLLSNCTYTPFIKSDCLNFSLAHQIQGLARLRRGCNLNIYFTDNFNPPRAIDLNNLQSYIKLGRSILEDKPDIWDCSLFKFFSDYDLGCIKPSVVSDFGGANVRLGVYQFAIQYVDANGNLTNYFQITHPIPVYDDGIASTFEQIDGGVNREPGSTTDLGSPPTGKSIVLDITGLDQSFEAFRIAIIESSEGTGAVSLVYGTTNITITGPTKQYVFRGRTNQFVDLSLEDILIPRVSYTKAKTVSHIDQRLQLGNLEQQTVNFSSFQKAANDICVGYFTQARSAEINRGLNAKDPQYWVDSRSYMRDEIYALGIVWVFNDGTESPAFHIPGRPKDKFCGNADIPSGIHFNEDIHNRPNQQDGWDSSIFDSTGNHWGVDYEEDIEHLGLNNSVTVTVPGITIQHCWTSVIIPSVGGIYRANLDWSITSTPGVDPSKSTLHIQSIKQNSGNKQDATSPPQPMSISQSGNSAVTLQYDGSNPPFRVELTWHIVLQNGATYDKVETISLPQVEGVQSCYNTSFGSSTIEVDEVERWRAWNTAVQTQSINTSLPHLTEGELAYWESEELYPDLLDCPDDPNAKPIRVYPEGNIRHHKMPDTTLERHYFPRSADPSINPYAPGNEDEAEEKIISLGLIFTNITLPQGFSDQIQGFRIVRAKREFSDKSVVDKGIILRNLHRKDDFQDDYVQSHVYNREHYIVGPTAVLSSTHVVLNDFYSLHTPEVKFNTDFVSGSHLKVELVYKGVGGWLKENNANPCNDVVRFGSHVTFGEYRKPLPNETNRAIGIQSYINPGDTIPAGTFDKPFVNVSQQETYAIKLLSPLNGPPPPEEDEQIKEANDELRAAIHYTSLKIHRPNQYGTIGNLAYVDVSPCMHDKSLSSVEEYGGDIFISRFVHRKTADVNLKYILVAPDACFNSALHRHVPDYFVESEINVALRHSEDANDPCQRYWPKHYSDKLGNFRDFIFLEQEEELEELCHNHYAYNRDFSKISNEKIYSPLADNFDFCSKCLEKFPHRIAYSEQSYSEELEDHYRVFKAFNYADLPTHTGQIENLFVLADKLYCHTVNSLWSIFTKEEQLKAEGVTISLGTGEFLAIPPREITSSQEGYGGSDSQWATVITEYGAIYPSEKAGKVFLFSVDSQFNELSSQGMRGFMEENLTCQFPRQYKNLTGEDYPFLDNPANPNGIGVTAAYDTRHKRIVITKRDYRLLPQFESQLTSGELFIDPVSMKWKRQSTGARGGNFFDTDTAAFQDLSFTLSFSFITNAWESFHSYLPKHYLWSRSLLLSSRNGSDGHKIWRHNEGVFQEFYDKKYPFILESIGSKDPLSVSTYPNIYIYAHVEEYDPVTDTFVRVDLDTFDKVIIYNSYQTTGELTLKVKNSSGPYTGLITVPGELPISKDERLWKFNGYRNLFTLPDEPMFLKTWSDIQYRAAYPIDKIPNAALIDPTKSMFSQDRFRDRYIIARFIYTNPGDRKIVCKYTLLLNKQSIK